MTKSKGGYKIRPDGKKDTGRPTVMTAETIQRLETAFMRGCTDEESCLVANISPRVLYDYQKLNPDFVQRKAILKQSLIEKSRGVIEKAILDGDKETAKWYLERKKKAEFSTRQETTGADGAPLAINIVVEGVDPNDDESQVAH